MDDLNALAHALEPFTSRLRTDVTAVRNVKGQVFRSSENITHERLVRHLNGGSSRGCYIIAEGKDTIKCAVIDLDDHKKVMSWSEKAAIAEAIINETDKRGLKAIPFISSGGNGIHLWYMWDHPQDAYSVRSAMWSALNAIDLSDGTGGLQNNQVEVYPRQNAVAKGRFGNQVWLPLSRQSVPLVMSDLLGGLAPLPREAIVDMDLPVSAPVKFKKRPKIDQKDLTMGGADMERYRSMLSFIGFDTGADYSYDVWLEVGFGLHHASGGSDEGLQLWTEWSSKGASYQGDGECEYKWETMHEDNLGENMVTGRSIEARARHWGWHDDLSGDFEDLSSNQTSQNPRQFEFISASKLISDIKSIPWLIEGYLEQNALANLFGDPEAGKSFVAIDIACRVATGSSYYGRYSKQGAVFYIAGEGHNGLARRLRAWQEINGIPLENTALFVSKKPAQIYNAQSAKDVENAIQELADEAGQNPALIIIDTLARNFGEGDENSTKDMNIFVQHVDALKNQWEATALIVHHCGHDNKGRARGAMALKAALDHEYKVAKENEGEITVTATKTKDGPKPKPIGFKIVEVYLPFENENGEPISGATLKHRPLNKHSRLAKLKPQEKRGLLILKEYLKEKGAMRELKENGLTLNCVYVDEFKEALRNGNIADTDKADSTKKAIRRIIFALNNSLITNSYKEYIWIADDPDNVGHVEFDDLSNPDGQDKPL